MKGSNFMSEQENFNSDIESLENEYFKDVSSYGWSYIDDSDSYAAASFVSGCLDILGKLAVIIREKCPKLKGDIEDILDRLYKEKKLEKDYYELVSLLKDLEDSKHYGLINIEIREDKVDFEDIMGQMENLFDEMKGIELNG